ncbi:MAG: ATP synthase F1 subunit epsilon [Pirellulales bacterium]
MLEWANCIVVTPEATVLDGPADFIALPLLDGEIGLAPGHAPMIGRLGYGEMRVVNDKTTRRYYLDGGFVQVVGDTVSILTGRAVPAEDLDVEVMAEQLSVARLRPAKTPDQMAARDQAVIQARARLRVARRAAKPQT